MATAMGGDVVMKLLQEFREMQDEAEVRYARTDRVLEQVTQQSQVLFQNTRILFERTRVLFENVEVLTTQVSALAQELGCGFFDAGSVAKASGIDGVHLDAANTRAIGAALVGPVRAMLG